MPVNQDFSFAVCDLIWDDKTKSWQGTLAREYSREQVPANQVVVLSLFEQALGGQLPAQIYTVSVNGRAIRSSFAFGDSPVVFPVAPASDPSGRSEHEQVEINVDSLVRDSGQDHLDFTVVPKQEIRSAGHAYVIVALSLRGNDWNTAQEARLPLSASSLGLK